MEEKKNEGKNKMTSGLKYIKWILQKQDKHFVTKHPNISCPSVGPVLLTRFTECWIWKGAQRPFHFSFTSEETEAWWEMLKQKLSSSFLKLPLKETTSSNFDLYMRSLAHNSQEQHFTGRTEFPWWSLSPRLRKTYGIMSKYVNSQS